MMRLRKAEEQRAAYDGAIQAIEPERRSAQDRQECAQRDALVEERRGLKAAADADRANAAIESSRATSAEQRIQVLNQEITRLEMRVVPPSHA